MFIIRIHTLAKCHRPVAVVVNAGNSLQLHTHVTAAGLLGAPESPVKGATYLANAANCGVG